MAFAGYKAGMTHAIVFDSKKGSPTFGQELQVPATILECPPLKIIAIRAYHNTTKGLMAFSQVMTKDVPKNLSKKLTVGKPKTDEKLAKIEKNIENMSNIRFVVCTDPVQSAMTKKKPEVFEIEVGGKSVKEKLDFAKGLLGKEIKIQDVLQEGEAVDIIAVTKGKGTQGPVKRFGIGIQNRHAKQKLRHVGAIGGQIPGKIRWQTRHAGQMGFQRRTEMNKRVMKIGEGKDVVPKSGLHKYGVLKSNFVLLQGSIAGSKKRLIFMRPAIRSPKIKIVVPEIREIMK